MSKTFVFGGARSGKSAYAERLACASEKRVIYLASAQARDAEMALRIAHHRNSRPAHWQTVEEPVHIADVMAAYDQPDHLILFDCLSLWLSNLLFCDGREYPEVGMIEAPTAFIEQRAAFLKRLETTTADWIIVSNEVGMGIIPQGAISRWYVDEAGRLNQAVAQRCEHAVWVAAGLPLVLKGQP